MRSFSILAILAVFSFTSHASNFTYNFTADWSGVSQYYANFGTGLDFSITVDNGHDTTVNQSYQFSEITGFAANAIGGTWSLSSGRMTYLDNVAFIKTDANGTPTLLLGNQNGQSGYVSFAYFNDGFQLGQNGNISGTTYYPISVHRRYYNHTEYANVTNYNVATNSFDSPVTIMGTGPGLIASPVPNPPAFMLMITGLLGFFGLLSRRHAQSSPKPDLDTLSANTDLA